MKDATINLSNSNCDATKSYKDNDTVNGKCRRGRQKERWEGNIIWSGQGWTCKQVLHVETDYCKVTCGALQSHEVTG